jgi:hypothetical protein
MEQNSQGLVYCVWWNSGSIDGETRNMVKEICNSASEKNRIYSNIDEKTKYVMFKSQENKDAIAKKEKLDQAFQNYKANSRAKVIPDTNESKDYFFGRIYYKCIGGVGGKKSKKMRKPRKSRKSRKSRSIKVR